MSNTTDDIQKNVVIEDDVAIYIEPRKRVLVSIALLVAVFGCNFSFRAFGLALPHIIANWQGAMSLYTLGSSLTTVAMTISTLVVARIAPRTGLKVTIIFGLLLILVCNMLTLLAPNMLVFVLLRILTGLGNGIVCGQMASSMNKLWPGTKRGTWLGVMGSCQAATSVIGPTVSGMLVDAFGWQSTYIVISILQLGGLLMFIAVCPKDTRDRFYEPRRFDTAGTASFVVFVTALILIASYGNSLGWGSISILIGIAVAVVSLIALVNFENKAGDSAILPWELFKKDKNFVIIFTTAFFLVAEGMAMVVFLSLYLQRVAGTSALIAGIPFTVLSVGTLIGSAIAPRWVKKRGKCKGLMILTAILKILPILFYGLWIYPEVGASSSGMMIVYIAAFIFGLGQTISITLIYTACAEYLPVESVGIGTANVYMGVTLGGSVGLAILQAVYNMVNTTSDSMHIALRATFIACAISGIIALLFVLTLKKSKDTKVNS